MSLSPPPNRHDFVLFGPHTNCTLELCPLEWTVYHYRPSVPANAIFVALFAIAMGIHIFLGIRWRTWGFMSSMILGCLVEIGGYVGRILLYNNPFSFGAFMIQIVLITAAPVFYTAAIYITLSRTINHFAPELSRMKPQLFYWIFIPADIVCLLLQAIGGAMSTVSTDSSQTGINIAMGGLALQVAVLLIFCLLFADYLIRYFRKKNTLLSLKLRLFFGFFGAASFLIFVRCVYRCYELSQGYVNSHLITDQALFIGLEGVLIAIAVFSLCIAHPGMVLDNNNNNNLPKLLMAKA